jgi:fumarate hydratase subunit alpha
MAKNLPKIIKKIVKSLCQEANYYIPKNILKLWLFNKSREKESLAKLAYNIMLKNAHIAGIKKRPLCQDTGQLLFFIEYTPKYAK